MQNKGLIIKKEWLEKIFNNGKHWEMRSTRTNVRGIIKLIESGSGEIVGECMLAGCHEVKQDIAQHTFKSHQVEDLSLLKNGGGLGDFATLKDMKNQCHISTHKVPLFGLIYKKRE